MNCDQSISYDELAAKDAEIVELNRRSSVAPDTHSHHDCTKVTDTGKSRSGHSPIVGGGAGPCHGKAPPVDYYSGDDRLAHFDDWLPSLERAASWNGWTDEKLLQFAGHLRGKALQEWNLFPMED